MKLAPLPRSWLLPLVALGVLAYASPALAQSSAADRARLLRGQGLFPPPVGVAPDGVEQGYAATSPNDSDLGEQAILKRVEKYEPFTLETGVPIYYTSNVALVDRGQMSDVIISPAIGITYAPKLGRTLYGEFTLRQQFFYYQDFTSFNFASFDAIAGVLYAMPELHNLTLRANLDGGSMCGGSRHRFPLGRPTRAIHIGAGAAHVGELTTTIATRTTE